MNLDGYSDPVTRLLTYGDCLKMKNDHWDNYLPDLGLTEEHIPELIQIVTDRGFDELEDDRLEIWAPIHAWRSLAMLKAEAAIAPLLSQFEELQDSDWFSEEMPQVFALIGPVAIPDLVAYLQEASHDEWARETTVRCLSAIAQKHSESRSDCIQSMLQQLERYPENPVGVNSYLICELLELKVVEAAPLMEQVYASGRVDEFLPGNWAMAQIELGLKRREDFTPEELKPLMPPGMAQIAEIAELLKAKIRPPDPSSDRSSQKSPFLDSIPAQNPKGAAAPKGFGQSHPPAKKKKKK